MAHRETPCIPPRLWLSVSPSNDAQELLNLVLHAGSLSQMRYKLPSWCCCNLNLVHNMKVNSHDIIINNLESHPILSMTLLSFNGKTSCHQIGKRQDPYFGGASSSIQYRLTINDMLHTTPCLQKVVDLHRGLHHHPGVHLGQEGLKTYLVAHELQ